jgi:hypothetical protein
MTGMRCDALEMSDLRRGRERRTLWSAHILVGEPASTPHQVRGMLSPEYALPGRRCRSEAHASKHS